jgi:two-component system chemotaxis response regulator CheB
MVAGHDLIVIGTSAGGVEALRELVRELPAELSAAILIVIHIPTHGKSVMPMILNRAGRLLAVHPQDGQPIQPGQIYVAPTNHHLLVKENAIHLTPGPKENGHRPAIDPLFRTAARYYGPRVVGVILSGALDDGTAGLLAIKQRGGVAVVQDPEEALYDAMPLSAIATLLWTTFSP